MFPLLAQLMVDRCHTKSTTDWSFFRSKKQNVKWLRLGFGCCKSSRFFSARQDFSQIPTRKNADTTVDVNKQPFEILCLILIRLLLQKSNMLFLTIFQFFE